MHNLTNAKGLSTLIMFSIRHKHVWTNSSFNFIREKNERPKIVRLVLHNTRSLYKLKLMRFYTLDAWYIKLWMFIMYTISIISYMLLNMNSSENFVKLYVYIAYIYCVICNTDICTNYAYYFCMLYSGIRFLFTF